MGHKVVKTSPVLLFNKSIPRKLIKQIFFAINHVLIFHGNGLLYMIALQSKARPRLFKKNEAFENHLL